jgi:flagellar basal-body rod modification protein FlgD
MLPIIAASASVLAAPAATPNSTTAATPNSTTATTDYSSMIGKNMFLQLLVAQLKNQDPLSPTDGTQFVAQLAQFQQLEQSVNTGQDITAIRADLDQLLGSGSTTT